MTINFYKSTLVVNHAVIVKFHLISNSELTNYSVFVKIQIV